MKKLITALSLSLTLSLVCFAGVIPQPEPCTPGDADCPASGGGTSSQPPADPATNENSTSGNSLLITAVELALSLLP